MKETNSPNTHNYQLGIPLIILSSVFSSSGQLFWKLGEGDINWFLILGFVFYGLGAMLMTTSFKYGEISVLHPMLGFSIVLSIFFGYVFLGEPITISKISGVALIFIGLIILGKGNK